MPRRAAIAKVPAKLMPMLETLFGTPHPVALITGAGAPRVGNAVARSLAARSYRVAVHAHRSQAEADRTTGELRAGGAEAMTVTGDVARPQDVERLVAAVLERFGRIDVLVNCAAIWIPKRLEDVTAADVMRHLEVNTLGTFLCCQKVGLVMVAQQHGGAIINVGDWAIARPYPDYAAYFPSKGAIPTLTRVMAVELARRNPRIRVNAVLPGPVMLPEDMPEAVKEATIGATLVQREGSPQHVADAVIALAENDFITGACLPVDGGRTIFPGGS